MDLLSRPRFRRYGDPQYEAIRVGRVDKSRGEAPFLFTTGPWRGETVWCDPRKMERHLSVASRYYQCSACGQLIVPGELYRNQQWGPWECEDADGWMSARACRWCWDRAWAFIEKQEEGERVWSDENLWEWLGHELGGTHDPLDQDAWEDAQEALQRSQWQARVFLAFLRRFAKGAKPATIRRVGPALLAIGFQRPPEGGLDHMLSTSGLPGEEWWRCDGCQQHPCDCTCPTSDLAPWQAEVTL